MARALIEGLVLLEGSFPVDHLNPGLKHLVHYGRETAMKGALDWFSMFAFERNNKKVKSMVQHTAHPLASLANHVESNIRTKVDMLCEKKSGDFECAPSVNLSVPNQEYDLSKREEDDMEELGVTSFLGLRAFKVCKVLGVHFRSGEWGCRRCGSVITTMYRDISRYCIVNTFLMVQDKTFASVTWLSTPVYPYHPFKLVVKVRLTSRAEQVLHPCVIPINRIEPCTVSILPDSDGIHFYMLRDKGIDRTTVSL